MAFAAGASQLALKSLLPKHVLDLLLSLNSNRYPRASSLFEHLENLVKTRGRIMVLQGGRPGTWDRVGDSDLQISREMAIKVVESLALENQVRKEIFGDLDNTKKYPQSNKDLAILFGDLVALSAFFHEVGAESYMRHYGDMKEKYEPGGRMMRLDRMQTQLVREHPEKGARDVDLRPASQMIHDHHERYDGYGYPRGSSGEKISVGGRIIALCSSAQAFMNWRSHDIAHPGWVWLEEMKRCSGQTYDKKNMIQYLRGEAFNRAKTELLKKSLVSESARMQYKDDLAFYENKYLTEVPAAKLDGHPRLAICKFYDPKIVGVFMDLYGQELGKGKPE